MPAARSVSTRFLYLALAIVFFAAAAGQAIYTVDVIHDMTGDYPVRPFEVAGPSPTVHSVSAAARRAGLEPGDVITTIDRRPVRGWVDLAEPIRAHRPGESVV